MKCTELSIFNFQGLCWVYDTLETVSFGQRVLFQGRKLPSVGESLIKRIIKKINVPNVYFNKVTNILFKDNPWVGSVEWGNDQNWASLAFSSRVGIPPFLQLCLFFPYWVQTPWFLVCFAAEHWPEDGSLIFMEISERLLYSSDLCLNNQA